MEDNSKRIIDRIFEFIDFRRLKVGTFEKEIGISQGYLSRVRQGNHALQSDVLEKIILKYNVDPKWLFTGQGEMLSDTNFIPSKKEESVQSDGMQALLHKQIALLEKQAAMLERDNENLQKQSKENQTLREENQKLLQENAELKIQLVKYETQKQVANENKTDMAKNVKIAKVDKKGDRSGI